MSTNPNTVKSQHELTNEGKRSSETLIQAISKLETTTKELERTKKQLEIAIKCMQDYIRSGCYPYMEKKLAEIKELDNALQVKK